MVAGPLLMGAGPFCLSRIPATSAAWAARLVRAALFIAITATFTPSLAAKVPAYDRGSPPFSTIQPLAPTPAGTPPDLAAAAQAASTEAFQLAMRVAGGLLLVGALVNLVGLERRRAPGVPSSSAAA